MIVSGGILTKTPSITIWQGRPRDWPPVNLSGRWTSYSAIYREQLWVYVVINKLAKAKARLPIKVYRRTADGREEARDHPYAELLRKPNERHSPFFLNLWVSSTFDVFGEAFLAKVRDRGGRPVQLLPLHPTAMHERETTDDGRTLWDFDNGRIRIERIPPEDLVHFKTYNPESFNRGLSPLEPLRQTLEHEDAARRATSAFWRNGGRPSVVLAHPNTLSQSAADRLKMQWDSIHSGADNFGKVAILEEGMKPEKWMLTAEEACYIDSRKLNREEVCGAYDVPPPVVHILDRATFSNITEQMRSMYRDTMAPRLSWHESELETQLRGSVRPGADGPDFGDDVYAEHLLDEVLRGDFEVRSGAYQTAINSGWMTPAEVRALENRPFIEGTDRLFINSTMVPLETAAAEQPEPEQPAVPPAPEQRRLSEFEVRTLMGRLGRRRTLAELDPKSFTVGLNGSSEFVQDELVAAQAADMSVEEFRAHLKVLGGRDAVQ